MSLARRVSALSSVLVVHLQWMMIQVPVAVPQPNAVAAALTAPTGEHALRVRFIFVRDVIGVCPHW